MGIVHAPIGEVGDALVVLDASRRLYAGLSRDGGYWHVVGPSQVDAIDADGNVVRPAGSLECRCKGFTFHGSCYRANQAEAFEAGQADRAAAPAWMQDDDSPVGAGEMVEASRG